MKALTVGVPAFKAQSTICDLLASVQIQTIKDNVSVIIATDFPGDDYEFVKDRYPDLDIKILPCDKNTGPGLARQRALDAAETPWITFIDADDVFMGPFALESLLGGTSVQNAIEVQGTFFQEIVGAPDGTRMMPRDDIGHPWVFGRAYNVKFCRDQDIRFSELRAMED